MTAGVEPNGLHRGDNVVFVDSQITDYQAIVSAITPGTKVFVFDGTQDGLQQIAQDLQGVHGLNSVDIITHGAADEVLVGTDTLTTSTIPTYSADLTAIGKALAPHGQIDLYGCDVAAAGDGFLTALQQATGRNVAASTTPIGATILGGTWTLDATTGPTPDALPANLAELQSFDGLLLTTPAQLFFDSWNGAIGSVLGQGNLVEQLTANGSTLVSSSTVINDGNTNPYPALLDTSGFVVDTALNEYFIASYNYTTYTWSIQEGSLSGGGLTTLYTVPFEALNANNTPTGQPITGGTAVVLGGLALDAATGELYFAQDAEDYTTGATIAADTGIYKISVTGGPVTSATLVTSTTAGLTNPVQITLDTADNLVFFDDSIVAGSADGINYPAVNNLDVANLTTGAVTVLKSFTSSDANFTLQGLDVDTANGTLYLATADLTLAGGASASNAILSIPFTVSGSGSTATASVGAATTLYSGSGAFQPTDIVVDQQAGIFYATGSEPYSVSFDGSGVEAAVFEGSLTGGSTLNEVFAISSVLPTPTESTGAAAFDTHAPQLFLADIAPAVTAGASATFHGGGSAVTLDSGLAITAGSSATLASATVTLSSGELSSDILSFNGGTDTETFADGDKITASYSAGVLTLSGTAAVGDYQAALDQVQFGTTSNADPTNGGSDTSRSISWVVNDGTSSSTAVTSSLTTVHVAPNVAAGGSATFTAGGSPVLLDSGLAVTDADSGGQLTGATVTIAGFTSGDTLHFTNQGGISGSYAAGTLTLSGAASIATYQTALESITFSTTNDVSTSHTIDWTVKDAASQSTEATSTVAVEVGPVVTAGATATFDGGGLPVTLDAGLTVTDAADSITGATVKISTGFISGDTLNFATQNGISEASYSNGVLTLAGTATAAEYQAALESITFSFTAGGDPTNGGADTARTISWQVTDAASLSSTTVTSSLTTVHTPPSVIAGGTPTFDGGGAAVTLDPGLTVTDVDSGGTLSSALVTIGFAVSGDTLNFTNTNTATEGNIEATVSSGGAALLLTSSGSTATLAQWQTALESVTYSFSPSNGNPTTDTSRNILWQVNDGVASSTDGESGLDTVHVAPTVTAGATVTAVSNGAAVALDSSLTVADVDSGGNLSGATVSIGTGFTSGDALSFTDQNGITGSYNAGTGVLTLSGSSSIGNYETALDSITFGTTSTNAAARTIGWTVSDGSSSNGASITATSTVDVLVGPSVTAGATATFDGGGSAVLLDSGLTISVGDGATNLTGATVSIASGLVTGDMLNFTTQNGISGSYSNGVLALSGNATIAAYQSALESITYSFSPGDGDPTGGGSHASRTIDWQVTDTASLSSSTATSTVNTVHVAPTVTAGASTVFANGGSPVALDGSLAVSDVDSGGNLNSATVTISSGFLAGDTLNFTTQNGISGVYSNGVLTLSGTATVLQYQSALDSITYSFAGDASNGGADTGRTITYTVNDGVANSTAATSTVIVDTAPTVSAGGLAIYVGGNSPVTLEPGITVSDSFGSLSGAKITIGNLIAGDMLNFTNTADITGVYSGGTLTLTGNATTAEYEAALASITYSDGNNDPTGGGTFTSRTIHWQVTDTDGLNSAVSNSTLDTQHVAPTVTAGATATFDGGGSPVALDSTLTVSDVDSGGNLTGARVQIVGFVNGEVLNFTTQNGISEASYSNGVLTLTGTATVAQYQAALRSVTFSFNPANGDPTLGNTNTQQSIYWVVNDGNTVNGTNETFPSFVQPINNDQPSLGLNQIVVEDGIYPTQGSGGADGIPLGSIRTFADIGSYASSLGGTASANGQLVPIASDPALFSILGTSYGGDGITTFGLPSLGGTLGVGFGGSSNLPLGDRFGADQFTLTTQELPHRVGGGGLPFDNDQPSQAVNYIINVSGVYDGLSTNALGEVIPFLGNFAPAGYMFASGQLLSISQDPALFSLLGTTYGGDGITTFALPDLNGKTIIGAGTDNFQTVLAGTTTGQDATTITTSNLPGPVGGDLPVSNDQPSVALTYLVATGGVFPSSSPLIPDQPDVGEIIAYAGSGGGLDNMLQDGWAVANGATLSIAQNPVLFAVLGTTYGGNGTTTFDLPDLVGRSIAGVGTNADGTSVRLGETYGTDSFTLQSYNLPLPTVATSTLDLVHTPPTVTAGTTATFDGGGSPVAIDPTLTVSVPDSGDQLTGATVRISGGLDAGDMLNFTNQSDITGTYSNGTLTLTGDATGEQYQAAIDLITYSFNPADGDPTVGNTDTTRTISYTVNDGVAISTAATSTLDTVHVAPSVVAGDSVTFVAGGAPVALDSGLTVSDADSGDSLTGATVKIDNGFLAGDSLNFTSQNGITEASYSNGTLTLTGNATVEQYQAALDSVTFSTTNDIATSHTIDWTVTDSVSSSTPATSTVTVQVGPIITAGATATFTGGTASSGQLDPGLAISDLDGATDLTGATVTISSGFLTGDSLNFTNIAGITGSYDAIHGVLTLTGNATLAQYQTALESVSYSFSPTFGDPTGLGADTARTISWQATDTQSLTSPAATSTLDTVHVAPTLTTGGTVTFVQNGSPVTADIGLSLSDPDSGDLLSSATVQITSGLLAGDTLSADTTGLPSIIVAYNNGLLTLTGSDTLADYQAVLRSVTFSSSSANPTDNGADPTRTLTWTINDGASTNTTTETSVVDVHALPTVVAGTTATFTGGGSPVTLDGTIALNDSSSGTLNGATVNIATGFINGDLLTINGTASGTINDGANGTITYAFSGSTLTLSGTDTTADYQAALALVSYTDGNNDPTGGGSDIARTISWQVTDGVATSVAATSTLDTVHVAPTVTAGNTATFIGGGSPVTLDGTLTVADVDSGDQLTGATVNIASGFLSGDSLNFTNQSGITGSYDTVHGVLTLTGNATVEQYQTALDSISYSFSPTNGDPTGGGADTARVISWTVNDGNSIDGTATGTSTLETVHTAPIVVAGNTATFIGGGSPVTLDGTLTVTDADSNDQLTGATVNIASGFLSGDSLNFTNQSGITGSYDTVHGVLTLTGNATVEQYQAALDSISYSFSPTNGDPTGGGADTARTIGWTVTDGSTSNGTSAAVTSTLDTVHVAPTVVAGGTATFIGGSSPVTLDGTLTVTDVDSNDQLTGATVNIASGFLSGDSLNFTNQSGITGSYDTVHGVLTLTGNATVEQYQAALDSISYSFSPTNGDPTGGGADTARTIGWTVTDGSTSNGTSAAVTSTLDTMHVAPTVAAGGTATFIGGGSPVTLDGALTVADVDSGGNLTGATVTIGTGFIANADTLGFTSQNGITGSYDAVHGVLTLAGTATVAQYQAALDSVTYSITPANGDPTNGGTDTARTIDWTVTDGSTSNGTSAAVTSTLTTVHVPATIATDAPVTFTQNGSAATIDATLAVADVDSNGLLTGATVSITSGMLPGDTLSANTAGSTITASYSHGVLTLTGIDTLADYRAVLQSVQFSSSSSNPTGDGADPGRAISWSVNDGASITTAQTTLNVQAVPTVVAGADVGFQAGPGKSVVLDPTLGAYDGTSLTGATVTIAGGYQSGEALSANTAGTNITASYSNGVLTLTGKDTPQDYQSVLSSVTMSGSSVAQSGPATIDWQISDQNRTSQVATSTVNVTAGLAPPPNNNQSSPLPAPVTINIPVAEFSGLVTNAVFGGGEFQFLNAAFNPAGAVHVIYSDVTASIGPDGAIAFNLPLDALDAALGGDVVSVTASLANGQPLPAWLHFDTQNGQFAGLLPDDTNIATGSLEPDSGTPGQPHNLNGAAIIPPSITIEVIARDSRGNISITDFTIDLSVRTPPKGDRHGWNLVPGHNAFEHWAMLRDATPLSGEPILWHHGSAADIDRDGVIHVADHVPAGRVGFSDQIKVHGLHALNADRAALLRNLRHIGPR